MNLFVQKDVEGVELPVEEGVEGMNISVQEDVEDVELFVEEEVEGVGLSVGEEVDSWLYFSIFSFNLFMYFSCDFLPRSCLLEPFVPVSVLFIFILSKEKKINEK